MKNHPEVIFLAGARPNYMKIAPIWRAMKRPGSALSPRIVHTGQHYDPKLFDIFFRDLEMDPPDVCLAVGSGTHGRQTGRIMIELEEVLLKDPPSCLVVVGDVNSTLAGALVATKAHIPVAHVEAGLRSGDRSMPEEINRLATDAISDLLFTTCRDADENLLREGAPVSRIHFVGNTMIDSLEMLLPRIRAQALPPARNLEAGGYIAATLHRPHNVDDPDRLASILEALGRMAEECAVVLPLHPRTRQAIGRLPRAFKPPAGLRLLEPLGYIEFMRLVLDAALVLTDSGGIQEETSYLGIPCLTLRPNTERPITITEGTNELVDLPVDTLVAAVRRRLAADRTTAPTLERWDGQAAPRIVSVLTEYLLS